MDKKGLIAIILAMCIFSSACQKKDARTFSITPSEGNFENSTLSSQIMPELLGDEKDDVRFLSAEQWALLDKGYRLLPSFELSTGHFLNDMLEVSASSEKVVNGLTYKKYMGKQYNGWNDFYADMLCVFTKEYFDKINAAKIENTANVKTYIDIGGDLYFIAADRGANPTYLKNSNRYELIEFNDQRIEFYLIAYYISLDDVESDNAAPSDFKRYLVVLDNTQNGWRISELTLPY